MVRSACSVRRGVDFHRSSRGTRRQGTSARMSYSRTGGISASHAPSRIESGGFSRRICDPRQTQDDESRATNGAGGALPNVSHPSRTN